ncbi:tyrosine-type recombinase/integrase [Noviherbaspirillum malthae]|uniref:tyrosine-type recombinase/integrase n=1 Tax=Noviherbaspirillum malthae TaxID=1260987 RepID=UPI00188E282E|nr:tyrosine-type recombinase/integrase [Noviherbaspirillum malthae]
MGSSLGNGNAPYCKGESICTENENSPCTRLRRSLLRLEGAYAENTLRAYRADFEAFIAWCDSIGLTALPASAQSVAQFVFVDAATAQSSTVRRRIAAIGRIHRLNGLPDPTKSEEVVLAMRRMHRQKGRRQKQALGLTASLLDQLLAATDDSVKGLRDRVLLRIAYDTMRRRSELVNLLIEDLQLRQDGTGSILMRFSKTDQEGEGKKLSLSKKTMSVCAAWLKHVKQTSGPILRKVSRYGVIGKQLDAGSIPRIYKALAKRAGLSDLAIAGLSGHSGRVGAAQDMLANGRSLAQIMNRGGWKRPDTVMRYVEFTDSDPV